MVFHWCHCYNPIFNCINGYWWLCLVLVITLCNKHPFCGFVQCASPSLCNTLFEWWINFMEYFGNTMETRIWHFDLLEITLHQPLTNIPNFIQMSLVALLRTTQYHNVMMGALEVLRYCRRSIKMIHFCTLYFVTWLSDIAICIFHLLHYTCEFLWNNNTWFWVVQSHFSIPKCQMRVLSNHPITFSGSLYLYIVFDRYWSLGLLFVTTLHKHIRCVFILCLTKQYTV